MQQTELYNQVLETISKVCSKAKASKFHPQLFTELGQELGYLSENLGLKPPQAFFFSLILNSDFEQEKANFGDLATFMNCNSIDIAHYSGIFDELEEQMLISSGITSTFRNRKKEFSVPEEVKKAILQNEFPLQIKPPEFGTVTDVLEQFYELAEKHDERDLPSHLFFHKVDELLKNHQQFPIFVKIRNLSITREDRALLLYMLWKTLMGNQKIDLCRSVEGLIHRKGAQVTFIQMLITGGNRLVKNDYLEVEEANFFNNSDLKLGDKGIALLEDEGLKIKKAVGEEWLVAPEKIEEKALFFNPEVQQQLEMLEASLQQEKLSQIQQRLKERHLPPGITCILYGSPGTGKTESVYQMARKTGRQLLKVEISETKSKWFGESEKLIKKVFTSYNEAMKKQKSLPILLFNEADAILGRRKDVNNGSVAQTENAIQNILLEELENFKGIFIATTNLVSNLDSAFDRRFLFKVEYQKPESAVKQQIWQDRLPVLSSLESLDLAERYDFSGGQIENIVRKILIREVLHEGRPEFSEILDFCQKEQFRGAEGRKIGYGN